MLNSTKLKEINFELSDRGLDEIKHQHEIEKQIGIAVGGSYIHARRSDSQQQRLKKLDSALDDIEVIS